MTIKYSKFNPIPYEAHVVVLGKIRKKSRVLDIGCATGYFAKKLQEKKCQVWGVDTNKKAATAARKYCQEVIIGDVENMGSRPVKKNFFDYILFLDILEHLKNPLNVLSSFLKQAKKEGIIIISVPNIAHISIRLRLLFGHFDYEKMGIMDEFHLHFFTKKTLLKLINQAGLKIIDLDYSADFGQVPFLGKFARKIPKKYQYLITRIFNTILAVQFIAVCEKR